MDTNPELVMLGAAPDARGCVASVVEAYRQHGLFKRWPVHYIATRGRGRLDDALTALRATRRLVGLLAEALLHRRRLVVHAHCEADSGFWRQAACLALAHSARSPYILHLHGGGFERLYDRSSVPARELMRLAFSRAACIIAPSEAQRAWAAGLVRGARVAVVPPPVATPALARAAERPNMVLFLGKLEAERGIFDLVDAIAAMRAAIPDLRLVCAGEGDRAGVARYAERRGVGDAVKFTGWVGPSGKRALLENAAAVALPCYFAGLPLVLLEAMSAGVPVVASPVGAIPEVVVDGASGFLVAPGDTAALARVLRRLLCEPALAERIGAAARETARVRFAPERVIPRLEEIYADLGLDASGGAPGSAPAGRGGLGMRKAA